jgi:hypothetical protein
MTVPTPPKLLEAIAADAGAGFITNPMPETQPPTVNGASIQLGFPPKTMQNELAGGLPPLGQDMNGFLFLISSHTLYMETGQTYKFDSDISTAIGGYPQGTILGMADGTGLWLSIGVAPNTTDPDGASPSGWQPIVSYGIVIVPVTGGTVNVTPAQSRKGVILLNGTLISNLTVNLPNSIQEWLIVNQTTGSFTTTVKTAAGGSQGVTVPQGGLAAPVGVYCVGDNNIYPTVAPLGIPIDQNPTPLTIVERTNAGYVLATYFNTNAPVDNLTAARVFTENGDGFIRKNTLTNFEAQMLLQGIGGQVTNGQVPFSVVSQWAAALFSSPAFTGVPTAPTAGLGTSTPQIATTAFANPGVTVGGGGVAVQLPSGYILQIGTCNPNGGTIAVTLPRTFPNAALAVFAGGPSHPTQHNAGIVDTGHISVSNTGGISYYFAFGN